MTTNEAYRLFWSEGLNAHSKTSRKAFWKAFLANLVIFIVLSAFSFGLLGFAYLVAIFVPKLSIVSRRLISAGLSQTVAVGLVSAEAVFSIGLAMIMLPLTLCVSPIFNLCAGLLVAYKFVLLVFCAMPAAK